jgi:hypothetical protein
VAVGNLDGLQVGKSKGNSKKSQGNQQETSRECQKIPKEVSQLQESSQLFPFTSPHQFQFQLSAQFRPLKSSTCSFPFVPSDN